MVNFWESKKEIVNQDLKVVSNKRMSRLVRILGGGKKLVEISGLHGIWVGTDHLCQSTLTLYYLNHKTEKITYKYGEWEECKKDVKILEKAKMEFNKDMNC